MVANFGAVGALSCRITAGLIEATVQTYSLTGCQLDPGELRLVACLSWRYPFGEGLKGKQHFCSPSILAQGGCAQFMAISLTMMQVL